jgi:hypothetical protein
MRLKPQVWAKGGEWAAMSSSLANVSSTNWRTISDSGWNSAFVNRSRNRGSAGMSLQMLADEVVA